MTETYNNTFPPIVMTSRKQVTTGGFKKVFLEVSFIYQYNSVALEMYVATCKTSVFKYRYCDFAWE